MAARQSLSRGEWKPAAATASSSVSNKAAARTLHNLGSRDIIRDLRRNLAKENVSRFVTLITGNSSDAATIANVRRALAPDQIRLLVIDADGLIKRDIDAFADVLAQGCWIVIDDYYGPAENAKVAPTRNAVDALEAVSKVSKGKNETS